MIYIFQKTESAITLQTGFDNSVLEDHAENNQIKPDSFYLYNTHDTAHLASKEEYSIPNQSDYQTIPGYSDILETKLSIDDYKQPQVSNYDSQNIADLNGQEYQQEQAYLQRPLLHVVERRRPTVFDKEHNQVRSSLSLGDEEAKQTPPTHFAYYKRHRDRYDPFAFQSTRRTKPKYQTTKDRNIFADRLDSRFSIQVLCEG